MKTIKFILAAIAAVALFGVANAQRFEGFPVDYQNATVEYVESRLHDVRRARVTFDSDPYPVYADFGRRGEYEAWAVDVSVDMRMRDHTYTSSFTVIFVNGAPVAFEEDIRGLEVASMGRLAVSE
ncbi:MAG: hypothetical protein AAFW81_06025 [Pseudomonadota bacterium]